MIIILNGPLGIGKSTLAEALGESIDWCATLSGDHLIAVNPSSNDEINQLHSAIQLLVRHHLSFGYRHFVIEHFWATSEKLNDLRSRLAVFDSDIRTFRLTLSLERNLSRIERRATAKALDEREFELDTVAKERAKLEIGGGELGEPFDVTAPPEELVRQLHQLLAL